MNEEITRTWKKRPSEIRGYNRAYYINTIDRDYIRVDYSLKDKKIRLYIELSSEGGNSYYSVIENGSITIERSISTGRSFGFEKKFRDKADIINSLPNEDVLKLFNSLYGISVKKAKQVEKTKKKNLDATKKKYFLQKTNPYKKNIVESKVSSSISFIDFIDLIIGGIVLFLVFLYNDYSFVEPGVVAAFYGMIVGFFDMFVREREPIFSKILLFLFVGVSLYVYGYFIQ